LKLQYSYEPVKLEKRNIFYLDILDLMIWKETMSLFFVFRKKYIEYDVMQAERGLLWPHLQQSRAEAASGGHQPRLGERWVHPFSLPFLYFLGDSF
jgi:hypothetical protein